MVEAGGGEAEGQEQAEAELAENATVRDQAPSDAERQIDDAIEAQDEPASGERPEGLAPLDADRPPDAETGVDTTPGSEGGGISGRPGARLDDAAETPGVPATGSPATEPQTGDAPGRGRGGGRRGRRAADLVRPPGLAVPAYLVTKTAMEERRPGAWAAAGLDFASAGGHGQGSRADGRFASPIGHNRPSA